MHGRGRSPYRCILFTYFSNIWILNHMYFIHLLLKHHYPTIHQIQRKIPYLASVAMANYSVDSEDSDEELGAYIYSFSRTAQLLREEAAARNNEMTTNNNITRPKRKSSAFTVPHLPGWQCYRCETFNAPSRSRCSSCTVIRELCGRQFCRNKNKRKAAGQLESAELTTNDDNDITRPKRKSPHEVENTSVSSEPKQRSTKKRKRYTCSYEGCNNQVQRGGVCIRHGASWTKKTCGHEGCTNNALRRGVCWRHGASRTIKTCSHVGCTNQVQNGGVCIRHGAKKKIRKTCSYEGCTNKVVQGGVCKRHGAKVKRKT